MICITTVIPAAGASRRMGGRDKLLEPVDGVPLLRSVALRALAVSADVCVTLPALTHPRTTALSGLAVRHLPVPDAVTGMSASLRRAAAAVPEAAAGMMILPADMPDLSLSDLRQIIRAFIASGTTALVQATSAEGTPGHPVVFPKDLIPAFQTLTGDEGARSILATHCDRLLTVPLPGTNALIDLDTPAAWDQWRADNPDR